MSEILMRVKAYTVVIRSDVDDLVTDVQELIDSQGYQPLGGIRFDGTQYLQTMVLYEAVVHEEYGIWMPSCEKWLHHVDGYAVHGTQKEMLAMLMNLTAGGTEGEVRPLPAGLDSHP